MPFIYGQDFFLKKMSLIISLMISKILGNIILGYVRVSSREQINGTGSAGVKYSTKPECVTGNGLKRVTEKGRFALKDVHA